MKKIYLIKIGGRLLDNENSIRIFAADVARISKKASVVIVHGGGSQLSAWLDKLKIEYHFVDGQRYTSREAVGVAEMVLSGGINKRLVGRLAAAGLNAVGLSLKDAGMVSAKQVGKLGRVGKPCKAHPKILKILLKNNYIPVVSTIGADARGETLNVNADWVCPVLAKALKADRMIYLTDVSGILDDKGRTIPVIRTNSIAGLVKSGVIHSGMVPKAAAAADVVRKGVKEIDIINGSKGVKPGSGTRIIK